MFQGALVESSSGALGEVALGEGHVALREADVALGEAEVAQGAVNVAEEVLALFNARTGLAEDHSKWGKDMKPSADCFRGVVDKCSLDTPVAPNFWVDLVFCATRPFLVLEPGRGAPEGTQEEQMDNAVRVLKDLHMLALRQQNGTLGIQRVDNDTEFVVRARNLLVGNEQLQQTLQRLRQRVDGDSQKVTVEEFLENQRIYFFSAFGCDVGAFSSRDGQSVYLQKVGLKMEKSYDLLEMGALRTLVHEYGHNFSRFRNPRTVDVSGLEPMTGEAGEGEETSDTQGETCYVMERAIGVEVPHEWLADIYGFRLRRRRQIK